MKHLLRLITLSLLAPPVLAATGITQPNTLTMYCPPPSAIKKDPVKLNWTADRGTFRSYDLSFAKKIHQFVGAQWNGAAVGQITCIYKTLPKTSFPLLLIFHTLTLNPTGGAWSKNLGGYKNCNALDIKKCPFKIRLKPKSENIYKEAESLKSKSFPNE